MLHFIPVPAFTRIIISNVWAEFRALTLRNWYTFIVLHLISSPALTWVIVGDIRTKLWAFWLRNRDTFIMFHLISSPTFTWVGIFNVWAIFRALWLRFRFMWDTFSFFFYIATPADTFFFVFNPSRVLRAFRGLFLPWIFFIAMLLAFSPIIHIISFVAHAFLPLFLPVSILGTFSCKSCSQYSRGNTKG